MNWLFLQARRIENRRLRTYALAAIWGWGESYQLKQYAVSSAVSLIAMFVILPLVYLIWPNYDGSADALIYIIGSIQIFMLIVIYLIDLHFYKKRYVHTSDDS